MRAKGNGEVAPRKRAGDSSDDDESSDDGEAAVSAADAGRVPPPCKPAAPKAQKQGELPKSRLALGEVSTTAPQVDAPAVEPVLTHENAAGRFVFAAAALFQAEGIGGYVAKIRKVAKDRQGTTTVQFKDADGKITSSYFQFDFIKASFKTLS